LPSTTLPRGVYSTKKTVLGGKEGGAAWDAPQSGKRGGGGGNGSKRMGAGRKKRGTKRKEPWVKPARPELADGGKKGMCVRRLLKHSRGGGEGKVPRRQGEKKLSLAVQETAGGSSKGTC